MDQSWKRICAFERSQREIAMIWGLYRDSQGFLASDVIYLGGCVLLFVAAAGKRKGKNWVPQTIGVAWCLIMAAFFWRMSCALDVDWQNHELAKAVAEAKAVAHTLPLATLLTSALILWCTICDYRAGKLSPFGLLMWGLAASAVLLASEYSLFHNIWRFAGAMPELNFP
jgi:hypothetical protein